MSPLRILSDNKADIAVLTVSGAAAGMGADKLKTDIKGEVCRVLSGTTEIVAVWDELQTVAAVVIPASNLGASSLIRVRVYSDEVGANLLHDTGDLFAAPGGILENWDFHQPLNVNQFAFGFPPSTAVYLPEHYAVRRVVINIEDPDSTFIDMSRLLIGPALVTEFNAAYGQSDGLIDMSTNTRAASGDLKTDQGPKSKRMSFTMDAVIQSERAKVKRILDRGIGRFLWISIMSGDGDPERERDKSIYGKLAQPQNMQWVNAPLHSTNFEIEGF